MRTSILALTIALFVLPACTSTDEAVESTEWPLSDGPVTYVRAPEAVDEAPGNDDDVMLQFQRLDRVVLISVCPIASGASYHKILVKAPEEVAAVLRQLLELRPKMLPFDRQSLDDGAALIFFGSPVYWIPPEVNLKVREILRPWDEELLEMEWVWG